MKFKKKNNLQVMIITTVLLYFNIMLHEFKLFVVNNGMKEELNEAQRKQAVEEYCEQKRITALAEVQCRDLNYL